MNITIDNIKYSSVTLLLVILTLLVYSCIDENEAGARIYEGERIPLSISMGTRNTTNSDEAINSVRAIVFNDKNQLVCNEVINVSVNDDNTYTAKSGQHGEITTFISSAMKHRSLPKSLQPLHWKIK